MVRNFPLSSDELEKGLKTGRVERKMKRHWGKASFFPETTIGKQKWLEAYLRKLFTSKLS